MENLNKIIKETVNKSTGKIRKSVQYESVSPMSVQDFFGDLYSEVKKNPNGLLVVSVLEKDYIQLYNDTHIFRFYIQYGPCQ